MRRWRRSPTSPARKAAEESLRATHADLENRVEKRTSQLMEANVRMRREVEERERAQREMHAAKDAADTANQAKSGFLANMSHELRTPLNAVIGFSELLEQEIFGELNTKQRNYVKNVLVSGRHLLQLVNDILDISKVEAGRMDLAYERTPIGSIVDVVRSVITAVAAKKGIELDVDMPPTLPEVHVDPGRIKQVLYNLIANAIKFTPRGGVVRVSARADAKHLTLTVSDTGVGIAAEDLPRLFREFEQLPQPGGVRPEGTGLGLALTRRLVELHGGKVEVAEPARQRLDVLRLPAPPLPRGNHPGSPPERRLGRVAGRPARPTAECPASAACLRYARCRTPPLERTATSARLRFLGVDRRRPTPAGALFFWIGSDRIGLRTGTDRTSSDRIRSDRIRSDPDRICSDRIGSDSDPERMQDPDPEKSAPAGESRPRLSPRKRKRALVAVRSRGGLRQRA